MEERKYKYFPLGFFGEGSRYFGIWVVNIILTILTLGLYYPWAKVANRKYLWNSTAIGEDRFVFHGTGNEIFKGFVIAYLIIVVTIIMSAFSPGLIFIFYLCLLMIMPFAIFGAWRYRVSRTSWRGIYFSFNGNMREFFSLFIVHFLLMLVTLGIYGPWFRVKIEKYLISHTKFGQYEFDFEGEGADLFVINLVGTILTIITLYIYLPWFIKNRFKFTIDNTVIYHGDKKSSLRTNLDGGDLFGTLLLNAIITTLTLGLATPWAIMRTSKIFLESVHIPADVDLDALEQNADGFNDATGDSLIDVLDVGLDF
ncbi:MAG: YjgN family protein [Deltaproteobacteria bacterium]